MWWIRKPIFRVLLGLSPIVFSLDPDPGLILNLPTAGENWTFPENSSTTSDNSLGAVNGSLSEIPRYACLGRQYGPDLDIGDCREAANTMIETLPTQMGRSVRFGNGHGGPYDVNLPYKSIASTGTCAVELALAKGAVYDIASGDLLEQAALRLIDQCQVDSTTTQGGIASRLGVAGYLGVIVTEFDFEPLTCRSYAVPDPDDCTYLLGRMPATTNRLVFGRSGYPDLNVELPYVIKEPDRKCMITIGSAGMPDTNTWYDLWQYATALNAMCVVGGTVRQSGMALSLGDEHRLFVELTDVTSDAVA